MKSECEKIQNLILSEDARSNSESELIKQHIAACVECAEFAASMRELGSLMEEQPKYRTSAAVVDTLISKVREDRASIAEKRSNPLILVLIALGLAVATIITQAELDPAPMLIFLEGSFGAILALGFALLAAICTFKRRITLGGSFAALAMLMFVVRIQTTTLFKSDQISDSEGPALYPFSERKIIAKAPSQHAEPNVSHSQPIANKEAYEDLTQAMREDLNVIGKGVKGNTNKIQALKVDQDKDRERVGEIFKKMLDRLADVQASESPSSKVSNPATMKADSELDSNQDGLSFFGNVPTPSSPLAIGGAKAVEKKPSNGTELSRQEEVAPLDIIQGTMNLTEPGVASGAQSTISGDPLVYAAGKAASGAANALSGVIKDRLSVMVPHVKIYSGREATAVFSKPIEVKTEGAPEKPETKVASISPGDSVRVKLLAGVNAPTDGSPYPVVFKVTGQIKGPSGESLSLEDSRLVAAAQGSLPDQRALFRLTGLSVRNPDGTRTFVPIDGWIVGEDGARGMEGTLIDPIGRAIAGAAEAGAISGIGEGFSQSQTKYQNSFFTGDDKSVIELYEKCMAKASAEGKSWTEGQESCLNSTEASQTQTTTPTAISRFWSEQYKVTNLEYKSPIGYWANTYIPGDPILRTLAAKLGAHNKEILSRYTGRSLDLEKNSRPGEQKLDAPQNAALGVSLTGDLEVASGPTRMLLQLSIKGAERKSALRQPLHVAIVIDPSATDPALIRSALAAFDRTKVAGDKFALIVAGMKEGTVIPLGDYRFGTVQAAIEKILSTQPSNDSSLSSTNALKSALKLLRSSESKDATFGSSTIVFLSGATSIPQSSDLESLAYTAGIEGIPVSTIGLGANAATDTLGAIALAGQGTRMQIINAEESEAVVKEELSATSKVVARALRLNIKLAPGTKLVDVLGSKSLDEVASERMRMTEKSIDKTMEKSFGITSDRGKDEDGIEVIIPAFYSRDSHVVLLDVVAQGPGPVADVQVKYKDLIEHKNGIAQASFALRAGQQTNEERSPSVIKNLLSFKLAEAFQKAISAVNQGKSEDATKALSSHAELVASLMGSISGLSDDIDLKRDLKMITEYIVVIESGASSTADGKASLLQSMELAGKKKISESGSE